MRTVCRSNQCSTILSYLMRHGKIDMTKAGSLGIRNLTARVSELRAMGLNIKTTGEGYALSRPGRKPKQRTFEDDLFPGYRP